VEERPPIWRVAVNILNKQSRTANKGWSSGFRVGRGANYSLPWERMLLGIVHRQRLTTQLQGMLWMTFCVVMDWPIHTAAAQPDLPNSRCPSLYAVSCFIFSWMYLQHKMRVILCVISLLVHLFSSPVLGEPTNSQHPKVPGFQGSSLSHSHLDTGLATLTRVFGHLDTGFSWFPCVFKQMLRWFPTLQVATTCFSCSPPEVNLVANLSHVLYVC
jgi:hypothetical protein